MLIDFSHKLIERGSMLGGDTFASKIGFCDEIIRIGESLWHRISCGRG